MSEKQYIISFTPEYWEGFKAGVASTVKKHKPQQIILPDELEAFDDAHGDDFIGMTSAQIARKMGMHEESNQSRNMRILNAALKRAGYARKQKRIYGRPTWIWHKNQ